MPSGAGELSAIDGKPLSQSVMRRMRADQTCGFFIHDVSGGIRAITVSKQNTSIPFPRVASGGGYLHGNGRAVTVGIKSPSMTDSVFLSCWLPTSMTVSDVLALLGRAKGWELLNQGLRHAPLITKADLERPRSREAQQLRYELLDPHASPMQRSRPNGPSFNIDCTQGNQTQRSPGSKGPRFSIANSCVCYFDLVSTWYCHVENYDIQVVAGGYSVSDDGAVFLDANNGGNSGPSAGDVGTGSTIGYYDSADKALADSLAAEPAPGCYEPPSQPTPKGGPGTWDTSLFVWWLVQNSSPTYQGLCARHVRRAMCFGGVQGACDDYQHPFCAKNYGPFLSDMGFSVVAHGTGLSANGYPTGYTPMLGDIVVFDYGPDGHVAGWDGNGWTSDFEQMDIQPTEGNPRSYTIYRRS